MYFLECLCNEEGSKDNACDVESGQCFCNANVTGDHCDQCSAGYYKFPTCQGKCHFNSLNFLRSNADFQIVCATYLDLSTVIAIQLENVHAILTSLVINVTCVLLNTIVTMTIVLVLFFLILSGHVTQISVFTLSFTPSLCNLTQITEEK